MSVRASKGPIVRSAPGISAWTGLPERDRALLLWLLGGDVVTAELAALLAYGHRRIAQRRLARLVGYGLLSGFWAANRQRPRGRYAYALTKQARRELESLVWPLGKPTLARGAIETVSPVIHELATHDVFAAFLRASDPDADVGLAGWVPERSLVRLTDSGYLRPDALAVVRSDDALIALLVERDLGTERGSMLREKLERYHWIFGRSDSTHPLHVGIVVESGRRAAAVRRILRSLAASSQLGIWVTTEAELTSDPYRAIWVSPKIEVARTIELAPNKRVDPAVWPLLTPGALGEPDWLSALDDRVLARIEPLRRP